VQRTPRGIYEMASLTAFVSWRSVARSSSLARSSRPIARLSSAGTCAALGRIASPASVCVIVVQGASGGMATGVIALGHAAGLRVWATGRDEAKRELATQLGADQTLEPGVRLPERVDTVIETVGEATWGHSIRALKPGGTIVIAGATTGHAPPAELQRIFFLQHRVSVMASNVARIVLDLRRDAIGVVVAACLSRSRSARVVVLLARRPCPLDRRPRAA
jgi:NADPH:quinone reductase-like Zn-dependent oxidoreductase